MKLPTLVNHPPAVKVPEENRSLTAPVYQSVKFEFETLEQTQEAMRGKRPGFFYLRTANPTNRQLEMTLAAMQGRDDCLVCSSGVGVIAQTLLALTQAGDHVISFVENYGPARQLIRRVLGRFGVASTFLSIHDLAGLEQALASRPTRFIEFESPTNPMNRVADIAAITRLAKTHGALTVLDNTMAGVHAHGQYEVDYFLHSLTKYAGGHGDVMGGAVIANEALIRPLRWDFANLGGALDPHAAAMIQRGLKTYDVRYRVQSANALRVAQFLSLHPAVARVYYPGLATDPGHELASRQMAGFGAVVTFDLRGAMGPFVDSTESLVQPSEMFGVQDLSAQERSLCGLMPGTVRLSIGLEDADDLIADLTQALEHAGTVA